MFKYSDKYFGRDKANLQQKKESKDDRLKGTEKQSQKVAKKASKKKDKTKKAFQTGDWKTSGPRRDVFG
jgi:hypothetical protein